MFWNTIYIFCIGLDKYGPILTSVVYLYQHANDTELYHLVISQNGSPLKIVKKIK